MDGNDIRQFVMEVLSERNPNYVKSILPMVDKLESDYARWVDLLVKCIQVMRVCVPDDKCGECEFKGVFCARPVDDGETKAKA
jgi:hypothetical protein